MYVTLKKKKGIFVVWSYDPEEESIFIYPSNLEYDVEYDTAEQFTYNDVLRVEDSVPEFELIKDSERKIFNNILNGQLLY